MNPFGLSGSARRRELWLVVIVLLALVALTRFLASHESLWPFDRYAAAASIVALAAFFATSLRRLHDMGRRGTALLIWLLPPAGMVLTIWLLLAPPSRRKVRGEMPATIFSGIVVAIILLVALLRLFLQPVWVTGPEMKPGLLIGDVVLARYTRPDLIQRGDLVSFRHPVDHRLQILRVIGLPHDSIRIENDRIWLNDQVLPRIPTEPFIERMAPQGPDHIRPRCRNGPVGDGGLCVKSRLTETLPDGRAYDVLKINDHGPAEDMKPVMVPDGKFFLLGDNRDRSLDSRFARDIRGIGLVPADQVVARGGLVLLSAAGSYLWAVHRWRPERFLKGTR